MYKNILIAVDGSDFSYKALDHGLAFGEKFGSNLHVIYVTPEEQIADLAAMNYTGNIRSAILEAGQEILAETDGITDGYIHNIFKEHRVGKISKEILDYAETNDIDLIVIGSRGLSGVSRTLLGSISNKVVNGSKVCVLVVK